MGKISVIRKAVGWLLFLGLMGVLLYTLQINGNRLFHLPPRSAAGIPAIASDAPAPPPTLAQRAQALVFDTMQPEIDSLPMLVVWMDNNEPVAKAGVALTPMRDAMGTSVSQSLSAQTNTSGRVRVKTAELTHLANGNAMPWMKVQIEAEGGQPETFLFERSYFAFAFDVTRKDHDPLILRLRRVYGLYGTVYSPPDAAGQNVPVAGAEVSLTLMEGQGGNKTTTTLTNAEGRYEFRRVVGEAFQLAARAGNRAARGRNIGLEKEKLNGPLNLYLEDGFPLTVLVNDYATQEPLTKAVVEAESNGLLTRAETDAQGFAEFHSLPLGRTALLARAEGYQAERFYVDVNGTQSDLSLFSLKKGGRVKIRTMDQEKSPVPNVDLQLIWMPMNSTLSVHTDAKGEVEVDGLPLRTGISVQAVGEYSLPKACNFALNDGPDEKEVCVTVWKRYAGETSNLYSTRQGWISGTVVNEANEPVAGAIVTTRNLSAYSSALKTVSVVTDDSGHFRFENLEMRSTGSKERPRDPLVADLVISEGIFESVYYFPVAVETHADGYQPMISLIQADTEDRIVLSGKVEVTGRVLDKETRAPITKFEIACYEPNNRATRRRIISEAGEFTIDALVEEFSVSAEGYLEQTHRMSRDKEENLTLFLEKSFPLEGIVVDASTRVPLENVCVGNSRSFGEKPFSAFLFEDNNTNADTLDFTNAQGVFRFDAPFTEGGLVFIREDLEKLWVKTADIEKYRDTKTGKLVFPMNPQPAPGSFVVDWFTTENSPAPPNFQYYISLTHNFGDPNRVPSLPLKEDPIFSYNNGRFRYDNLKPGEYNVRLPHSNAEGQIVPGLVWKTFKVESGKTTTLGWGSKSGETISYGVAP